MHRSNRYRYIFIGEKVRYILGTAGFCILVVGAVMLVLGLGNNLAVTDLGLVLVLVGIGVLWVGRDKKECNK